MQRARIRLSSNNLDDLKIVLQQVEDVCKQTGIKKFGPIPLPTKRLVIPVRKSPCGEGTQTWAKYEMRIHKRLIDVIAGERSMHLIMKIQIPETVLVEIELM